MATPSRSIVAALLALATFTASPALAAEPLDTAPLDTELEKYWATTTDRDNVKSLLYSKESRHEFTLFLGVVPNDNFYSYVPIGARWNFFFLESLGIEVFGSYDVAVDGDLKGFLEDNNLYGRIRAPQQLVWNASAALVWNPIYGKFAVFTDKLFHFDFFISLGAGVVGTDVENESLNTDSKVDVAGNLGLGVRFYINDLIALRLDYKQFLYGGEQGIEVPAEFTLGVSFWTP